MKAFRNVAFIPLYTGKTVTSSQSASQQEKPEISFLSKRIASKILFKIPLLSSFFHKDKKISERCFQHVCSSTVIVHRVDYMGKSAPQCPDLCPKIDELDV